jgi:N utilization substance protein B
MPAEDQQADQDEEEEEEGRGLAHLSPRRQGRTLAVQALFEVDSGGHTLDEVLAWAIQHASLPEESTVFAQELANGVLQQQEALDTQIRRFAPAWPLDQLSVVDRTLLRLAIYEVTQRTDIPPKAAINEAVELAKVFGSSSSPRFINGVLGAVMETMSESPQK